LKEFEELDMPIRVKSRVPLIFEAVEAETINIEDT